VELLYLAGCPNHCATVALVHSVLEAEAVTAAVSEILIEDYRAANARSFPGSPTVRVNGRDIENLPDDRLGIGFACRTYCVEGNIQGIPPRTLVEAAVRAAHPGELGR
jgi:hypothetical protein